MIVKVAIDGRIARAINSSGVQDILSAAQHIAADVPGAIAEGKVVQEVAQALRTGATKAERNEFANRLVRRAHGLRARATAAEDKVYELGVKLNEKEKEHARQLGEASRNASELLGTERHRAEMHAKRGELLNRKVESLEDQRNIAAAANILSLGVGGAGGYHFGQKAGRIEALKTWVPAAAGGGLLLGIGGTSALKSKRD